MTSSSTSSTPSSLPRDYRRRIEKERCKQSFLRFVKRYCHILASKETGEWVPFALWRAQEAAAETLQASREVVILKARQLGFTWLTLAFALWHILFHPIATVLLFSRRDDEAMDLLGERLRGMYERLPDWLRDQHAVADTAHEWQLSGGSRAMAFPTTGGRSYTATLVIVDEADFVPDLQALLNAVRPTVAAGGRLVLLSTADKRRQDSAFKKVYRAAKAGANGYRHIFLPWGAHPDRNEAWYEREKRASFAETGSLDHLHQEYPATDGEALSPPTLDKRIPAAWLEACYVPLDPLAPLPAGAPSVPGLEVYCLPQPNRRYVVGADPAEGNPTSDDSAACVLEAETGEEVAGIAGRHEMSVFAGYIRDVCLWYNRAPAMVERNNHGHTVLLALRVLGGVRRLEGRDGREGWQTSELSKATLYDSGADAIRNGEVIIHSLTTFSQLAGIDGNKLKAPGGGRDDKATAFVLANAGRPKARRLDMGPPTLDARTAADRLPAGVFG